MITLSVITLVACNCSLKLTCCSSVMFHNKDLPIFITLSINLFWIRETVFKTCSCYVLIFRLYQSPKRNKTFLCVCFNSEKDSQLSTELEATQKLYLCLTALRRITWVGVNCSKCDCSTVICSTLLAGNQLLNTK
jgi:hypothetical protein